MLGCSPPTSTEVFDRGPCLRLARFEGDAQLSSGMSMNTDNVLDEASRNGAVVTSERQATLSAVESWTASRDVVYISMSVVNHSLQVLL